MSSNKLDDSGVMELTRNIMIVSILALFMVIIFLVFLHLYSKWYWYRSQQGMGDHNNRRRGDFTNQRGLDASFLKTIRVIQFDPKDFKEGLECAVCLSELEVGERARILPKCDHGFHVECIDMWFHTHSTCPICRNPVSDQTEISLETDRTDGRDSQNSNSQTNVYETEVGTSTSRLEEANNQNQALPSEQASSSLQTYKKRARPDLVIEIPRQGNEDEEVSCSGMRSLKRILSSSTRFNPFSPGTGSSNV